MKRILLFLTLISLFSCSDKTNPPKLFTPGLLARQLFSIDGSKDTSLLTLHGSVIRITAGSFSISGNVQLEIKEAFTPAEMLAAGMTTESNGRPLRSGGMIYINAVVDGKAVELIKSIRVSIPNQYYDSAMQIFKGVETGSAGINWVDPTPVDSTPQSLNWVKGKRLFQSQCAACHNIFKPTTGPALANVERRGPWTDRQNLYDYIHNVELFRSKNQYVQDLRKVYVGAMTNFPGISNKDIDAILDYIKNETKRPGAMDEKTDSLLEKALPADSIKNTIRVIENPCNIIDTFYERIPEENVTLLNTTASYDQPANYDTTPLKPAKAKDMEGLRRGFNDPNPTSGMYDFQIKTLGWFNVDAFVEGYDGTANVKLWAQVMVDFEIDMHVYLFCPERKMLSIGYDKQGDKYFFNKINDGIPLFVNDRAILFAFGSKGDKMYYGISEFNIKKEQTIKVMIKETTGDEIRKALLSKEIDGIDIGIEKKEKIIIERPCSGQAGTDTTIATK